MISYLIENHYSNDNPHPHVVGIVHHSLNYIWIIVRRPQDGLSICIWSLIPAHQRFPHPHAIGPIITIIILMP